MAAKFDGVTLLIVGCVALVVCCVLMVAWRAPDASDVRNLGMPGSTAPGSTASGWAVPGSTASGWAMPGSTATGYIAPQDAPA